MWQGRPPRVGRVRRQQITQESRRIHALRRTQGWTVDQVQDEILRRFFGEVFPGEARMLAHGWNAGLVREGLQALSEAAGLDASGLQDADVLRWLRGETYPRDYLDRLCRLFQCHQAALGWPVAQTLPAIDYTPRQRPPEAVDTLARQMGLIGEVPAQLPEGDLLTVRLAVMINGEQATMPIRVPRAVLLEAGGAELLTALAGHPDPAERQRVTAVIKRRHPADMRSVAHFGAVLASYRTLEDLIGPRRLLDPVRSMIEVIDDLRIDAPAAVQRSLLGLAAQYWQFAGWLRVDLGDNHAAERAYDTALARAIESGTPALMRYVLACKSEQALMDGRPDAALVLAQEAQRDPETLTPAARAWAADLEARAHALNGDETNCQHQLDNARRLQAVSAERGRAEEPPWVYHFVNEAFEVHRGICLTDLGRTDQATSVLDAAVAAVPAERVRDRAYYLTYAARAYAADDEPEQADAVACEAAQLALETDSIRVLGRLRRLRSDAPGTFHELAELLPPPPPDN